MFDISFFRKIQLIREEVVQESLSDKRIIEIANCYEELRSKSPYVFNIETTNVCNMTCQMCPRTSKMTRKIETMDLELFKSLIDQIEVPSDEELQSFYTFVADKYGVSREDRSENAFYFYILANHLILHGYGEPVLDKYIVDRVKYCTLKNVPTYFSCVPANINLSQMHMLMKAGLGVVKFALDSLSDEEQKIIRGENNNFTEAYKKIEDVLEIKEKYKLSTMIVVTLVDLRNDKIGEKRRKAFIDLWKDRAVYAYVKSQDNRWYYEEDDKLKNKSHYEAYYCEFPWTSLTIMVDGSVVPCTQDYNCEMIFGNAKTKSLNTIWNNELYKEFREKHLGITGSDSLKCKDRCDLKMLCQKL